MNQPQAKNVCVKSSNYKKNTIFKEEEKFRKKNNEKIV